MGDPKALDAQLQAFVGKRVGPFKAFNPVNEAMIWQWCKAMGDENPTYLEDGYAPPTSLQMWTMRDVNGNYADGSTDEEPFAVLDFLEQNGFMGVIASQYDQTYFRYLKIGDTVQHYSTIISVSEKKSTGMGDGYFLQELQEFYDQNDEKFAEAKVTYLKFEMPENPMGPSGGGETSEGGVQKVLRTHPVENNDSKHYWQGLRDGKILIQKCSSCGTLRHPPQPMCNNCQSLEWGTVEATGKGTVHSYTTMHYPHIPPFDYPNIIVLVDLDEGVRLVSQMVDCKPDDMQIGQQVEAVLTEVQEGLTLPLFKIVK